MDVAFDWTIAPSGDANSSSSRGLEMLDNWRVESDQCEARRTMNRTQ
jgi:hypothetical protein